MGGSINLGGGDLVNGFIISKEAWSRMDKEERDWIIYETLLGMHERLKRLERWNRFSSFCGGILGGILAALGLKLT